MSGMIRVRASMDGKLYLDEDSELIIEPEGQFRGEIHCYTLEIYGSVQATIHAQQSVIIHSGAKVSGKVKTPNLNIYPGALVDIEGATD